MFDEANRVAKTNKIIWNKRIRKNREYQNNKYLRIKNNKRMLSNYETIKTTRSVLIIVPYTMIMSSWLTESP